MKKQNFRKPEEFAAREGTEPVSTRILKSAKETLQKAADKNERTLSWLVARVLEDYATWLSEGAGSKS